MRSIWKGTVSFGLVTIPVRLYSATEEKDVAFHQVRRSDGPLVPGHCLRCRERVGQGQEINRTAAVAVVPLAFPHSDPIALSDACTAGITITTTRAFAGMAAAALRDLSSSATCPLVRRSRPPTPQVRGMHFARW